MRNITGIVVLVISTVLALAGCHRPLAEQTAPASQAEETEIALQCPAGQRLCIGCNGTQFCATRCTFPVCPAPVAPAPEAEESTEVAELTPVGVQCGGVICSPGLSCCNPSCNICTPKGVQCTQQSCN
jgi:hypothetical protein